MQDILRQEKFDLVILGPTLTKNDRHHLAYMVKKAQPETRLLVTHTDGEGHPAVDATLETGRSMNALLEKIASFHPQAAGAASGTIAGVGALCGRGRLARVLLIRTKRRPSLAAFFILRQDWSTLRHESGL